MATADEKEQWGDGTGGPSPSRTTLVMDQILSRGPLLSGPATATTGRRPEPSPWAFISPVLQSTDPLLLAGHLAWLVSDVTHRGDRRTKSQHEDQIRILVRALDEGDEHDLLVGALEQTSPWSAGGLTDDDETIIAYASELTSATEGQPEDSPYGALAASAAEWVAVILDHRSSSTTRRPRG